MPGWKEIAMAAMGMAVSIAWKGEVALIIQNKGHSSSFCSAHHRMRLEGGVS